jgi:Zn-dependent protease with chaperone function
MSEIKFLYPATPTNVPAAVTQPSAAFKKEVSSVMGSIVFFFIVYVLLFILSIALVVGCVYAGLAIITHIRHWIGILGGIGMIGVGIMVFIFLVKFLFAVTRFDRSNSIGITETEQPELFAFIRRVTIDTETPFPKKIYLSPDVNACVFYDSSFWSMFLPIKKNLQIGLGLVNAVNVSEFKAVIAHEFGHFSQRSMKLGSFVYNVNKIIHNMLFENTSYSNFLGSWASVSDVFAFFANLTIKIAQGIQWVLRQVYKVVNKSYMSLSREMEFHADAVAASVSGSNSLVTALRRIELADAGYNIALQKCDDLFREKKISNNIYQNHKTVLKHLADEFKLQEEHGLPIVTDDFIISNNTSRVNFKDQWASHPTSEDRTQHLLQLSIPAEIVTDSAWQLFRDKEKLQSQLTMKVYENVTVDKEVITVDNQVFETKLQSDTTKFSLPDEYKGFYDGRQVDLLTDEEVANPDNTNNVKHIEEIFSAENVSLPKKIKSTATDIETLKAIGQKNIDVKTFDFDGVKYKAGEAGTIAGQLEEEMKQQRSQLQQLDKQAISFFMTKAKEKGNDTLQSLRSGYREYFELRRKADAYLEMMNKMLEDLAPIYSGQTITIEQINKMIADLKGSDEPVLKKKMKDWLSLDIYDENPSGKMKLEKFIQSNYEYFTGSSFFENELAELNELCNESWAAVNNFLFRKFKSILEIQLTLL